MRGRFAAFLTLSDRFGLNSRLALWWAIFLTTFVVERVTRPEVLTNATGAGATIAVGAIGILATVVGLYKESKGWRQHGSIPSKQEGYGGAATGTDSPAGGR